MINGKSLLRMALIAIATIFRFVSCSKDGSSLAPAPDPGSWRIPEITEDECADTLMHKFMESYGVPGVSVAIMRGSTLIFSKGYGYANITQKKPVTDHTLFRLASISKCFCAISILTLKEQGMLRLEDTIFGPGGLLEKQFPNATPGQRRMTVRMMLNHSSEITKECGDVDPCFEDSIRFDKNGNPIPTDQLIQWALDNSDTQTPGGSYAYCNLGFVVLQRIVEEVSGMDYEAFVRSVIAKAGLTESCLGHTYDELLENESAVYEAYTTNLDEIGYQNPLRQIKGAAGMISCPTEMMRLLSTIDGDDEVPDILSKETITEMYTPSSKPTMGLCFSVWGMDNETFQGAHTHGGNLSGTATLWCGSAKGDWRGQYEKPMSGAILCNARPDDDVCATFYLEGGKTATVNIDDAFNTVLTELYLHFDKVYRK